MGIDESSPGDEPEASQGRPDQWLPPRPPGQPQQPQPPQPQFQQPQFQQPRFQQPQFQQPQPQQQRPPGRGGGIFKRAGVVVGIALLATVLVAVGQSWLDRRLDDEGPVIESRPTRSPMPELPEHATQVSWQVEATALRDDIANAEYIGSINGDFDESYLASVGDSWLALTGQSSGIQAMLHGLDPETGDERWSRAFDGGFCAPDGHDGAALCASALERDRKTELGVRWRLHRLDPKTGKDQAEQDIDAWVTAVHLSGDTLVVLEQRRPAPHAVVSGYDATTLRQKWTVDLSEEDGHRDLFSPNRIIDRPEPKELNDLALDRPRFSDLNSGLVAIYAGQRTVFLKADSGKLVMMPHCTRPTDDGERIWCNTSLSAVAYSYRGKRLYPAEGVRLAAHDQDKRGKDIRRPVFINKSGELFSVDLSSGEVLGRYAGMGTTDTWAGTLDPSAATVGDHTFIGGDEGIGLLDPEADKLVWTNDRVDVREVPILHEDQVWFPDFGLTALRLRDGVAEWETEQLPGLYVLSVDGRVVGVGPEVVAVVEVV